MRSAFSTDIRHESRPGVARRWSALFAAGLVTGSLLGLSLVGTSAAARVPHVSGGTLSIQFVGPPISLNPGLGGGGESEVYTDTDYDPLIYQSVSGSFEPDLATSWGYVGKGNETFQMTLRAGVHFSDGSLVTPAAVKASIIYDSKQPTGPGFTPLKALKSIAITGKDSLEIELSAPDPDLPLLFSQNGIVGDVIGPKGLANPSALATSSDGAGAYIYKQSLSQVGAKYTYVRNPHYWDPAGQRYAKVVVNAIGNPSSVLTALETNQVQFGGASPQNAAAGKSAGLKLITVPFFTWSLNIDRTGAVCPALAKVQVRQALNDAIDRSAIERAVAGAYGKATDEVAGIPGVNGYVKADAGYYSYDPQKAKQLLAAAGYPNGFTMPVVDSGLLDTNSEIASAIESELSAIGVNMQLTTISSSINAFATAATSKQYCADLFPAESESMYLQAQQILPPGIFNPSAISDPIVNKLLAQANSAASITVQDRLYQAAESRMTHQGWFVPVYTAESMYFVNNKLLNVAATAANPNPDPVAPVASQCWYTR